MKLAMIYDVHIETSTETMKEKKKFRNLKEGTRKFSFFHLSIHSYWCRCLFYYPYFAISSVQWRYCSEGWLFWQAITFEHCSRWHCSGDVFVRRSYDLAVQLFSRVDWNRMNFTEQARNLKLSRNFLPSLFSLVYGSSGFDI